MAWRPYHQLIEGELDNRHLGEVTGWLRFQGLRETVLLDLVGDFHRDIRGAKIRLNRGIEPLDVERATAYMKGFAIYQTGKVGDITAGLPPVDYVAYPYVEWYSEKNGRIVLELEPEQLEVIGTPIPWVQTQPVNRDEQTGNLIEFMAEVSRTLNSSRRDAHR